ncbi:exodeoxyribonuclease VII large subunit [Aestuariimicrobium sp. p3-SID1156]|uniref:exodeoxyribonuclease VII large subunit n=1 Tax=Aestuariimicrobium sp. p3-SID1156 TaxID=2916038 RepID=UPI00223C0862|nr:exodeoxyribonuclease VII large subunit [Aestuariimicrobium sp. p3-SID1156]MCT1459645.1 exodeoxyribonuclease VII large subunit [Aestuariimicrobium sp. p3-SID1156]
MAGMQSSPEHPQPLGRVVSAVKGWVERCGDVWVEGQLIEINRRSGSTQFLKLRDSRANVSATLTCTRLVLDNAGPLAEGATVAAWVKPRVFEQSTQLTFECRELRPMGEGQLLARLEQLKRKLQAEGLFDPARKRRPPFLPRRIGLIAGQNSDAERDVLENTRRRWPAAVFEVRNTLVQGPNAAESVIAALAELDAHPQVDVIVIARGGGALEDLLPFSDEGLVRAVAAARTPVVSAIGHEKDSPILDNVADLRASTPTDAAKLLVPSAAEELELVRMARERMGRAVVRWLETEQHQLHQMRSRPVLQNPLASFEVHAERLAMQRGRLERAVAGVLDGESREVGHLISRARSLSPKGTLERGYAILTDGTDTITSVHDVDEGDDLMAYVFDGTIILEVRQADPSEGAPHE